MNRIPILKKASQINALCMWTEYSFNCNLLNVVNKMKKHAKNSNYNGVLCAKQVANRIQNDYGLVWKATRINQLNEMITIYENCNVLLHFRKWRKYTQNITAKKIEYFTTWRYIITNWKHRKIVAHKYRRRNLLKTAFQSWKIRYSADINLQCVGRKIMRARNKRLIKKYSSIWTLNLLSVLFYKNTLKTNIMKQWKSVIKEQRIEAIMDEQSVLYRRRVLLFDGLNGWKTYLRLAKVKRRHSLNAMLFRNCHLLAKTMRKWKKANEIMDESRIKYHNIIIRNENEKMIKSFRIWFKLYVFKKKLRDDMEISEWYHRVQMLSQSICFWRYFVGNKKKKRESEMNAFVFDQHSVKRLAYKCWKQSIFIRQNALKLSIKYEIYLERKLIMKTFVNWQQSYQQIKMYEYIEEYYINKTLKTFMFGWKVGAEMEKQTNKLNIESFREKYDLMKQNETKKYCLRVWIKLYEKNIDLKSKIYQFEIKRDIKYIESSFSIWRGITEKNINYKHICCKCSMQLNHFQIVYFINEWMNFVCRKNELYEKQQLIATDCRINTIKSVITNWKTAVIAKNNKYDFLHNCYHEIRKKQIWKYFEKWKLSLMDHQQ